MILINATTLKDKSTLSTNNFGANHCEQNTNNKTFLEILEAYDGICLKMRFWQNFLIFWEFRNFKKLVMDFYFINRWQFPLVGKDSQTEGFSAN